MKQMYMTLVAVMAMTSCSTHDPEPYSMERFRQSAELRKEIADSRCDTAPMVGHESGFEVLLNAKKTELSELKLTLGANKYRKLSQELNGYSVEWEIINKQIMQACIREARCYNRYDERYSMCKKQTEMYEDAIEKAHEFILRFKQMDLVDTSSKSIARDQEHKKSHHRW